MKAKWVCILVALVWIACESQAAPHSIFENDWAPPKIAVPRPATVPVTTSSTQPSPAQAAPARKPVPGKAEQAAARKLMKQQYAADLPDHAIPARRKLTEKLLKQAGKSFEAPVDRFVLLAAAINSASDAASLRLAFTAANYLGGSYEVDGLSVKADIALHVLSRNEQNVPIVENIKAVLELSNDLADVDDYVTAFRVCTMAHRSPLSSLPCARRCSNNSTT
jgi:hypothetical protein